MLCSVPFLLLLKADNLNQGHKSGCRHDHLRRPLTPSLSCLAPIEQIEPEIRRLWAMRQPDVQIVEALQKTIDTDKHGIG